MNELSYEAIIAEVNKLSADKPVDNPYIYRYVDVQIAIQTATQREQERIIKLLDQKHIATNGDIAHNESGNCVSCEVIALIKGENK